MLATARSFFVPEGDNREYDKSRVLANCMALELLHYGIEPEQALLDRIATHKNAFDICAQILEMMTLGNLTPPLFEEWETRKTFTFSERVIQIFGYMIQLSGNDLQDPRYMRDLRSRIEFKNTVLLELRDEASAYQRFWNLVSSNTSLDTKSQRDLVALAGEYWQQAPENIRSPEGRMAVAVAAGNAFMHFLAGPADALRYAAAMKSFDTFKLPADVKYANLNWHRRKTLIRFLAGFSFEQLSEAMAINRTAWARFMKHFHVLAQKEYPVKVKAAALLAAGCRKGKIYFMVAHYLTQHKKLYEVTESGNLVYRSKASRIQSAIDNKDLFALTREINAGYLFRNLAKVSHVCNRANESDFIEYVRSQIRQPKTAILLSLIQIGTGSKYRIIDSKGNTTVQEANYSPVITEIQSLAEREIYRRHGFAGKVKVKKKLRDRIVPFVSTNSELERGTKIPFNDTKYLYFVLHWMQNKIRTDLDHSYVCFDENWNTEIVGFWRQANAFIKQSGDIVNAPAPHGATEYGRIDLRQQGNTRYVVPIINRFSGETFDKLPVAYAGFMFSDKTTFTLSRDHIRYPLQQPACSNVPCVIDLKEQHIMLLDFNQRTNLGRTARDHVTELKKLIEACKTKKHLTVGRFGQLLSGDGNEISYTIDKNNIDELSCLIS